MVSIYKDKCEAENIQDDTIQYLGNDFTEQTAEAMDMAATRQRCWSNLNATQRAALKKRQTAQGTGKQYKVVSDNPNANCHLGYSLPAVHHPAYAELTSAEHEPQSSSSRMKQTVEETRNTDIKYIEASVLEELPIEHGDTPWSSKKQISVARSTAEAELDLMD